MTTGFLHYFYRQNAIANLLYMGEKENVALSQSLKNSLWAIIAPYLARSNALDREQLQFSEQKAVLNRAIEKQVEGLNIVKVKIYNLQEITIFSTEYSQIGQNKSNSSGFSNAINDEITTQLGHRDSFQAINSKIENRELLSTYIPIYDKEAEREIIGVFEIYKNHSQIELKNGTVLECYSQRQQLQSSIHTVWSFRDVTERQKAEQIIAHQAFHDALTGLANRSSFNRKLASAIEESRQTQSKLAVLFFDLDRFKTINDTLGHAVGDLLLQKVAKRLVNCIREGDTIARWGGDEFTILLPHINSTEDVTAIAKRIFKALHPPFVLENYHLHITTSIGIAVYPDRGTDSETLLKNADAALYKAKERRNNYQYYDRSINSQGEKLFELENKLRYALEQQEFLLHYQPIIDITTGRIVKMKALLRWQNPALGLIAPNIFIPIAEDNGLIVPIGEWVLEQACQQNKYWQKIGLKPFKVSVNLSPRQFHEHNLTGKIVKILRKTGLQSSYLELEITETVTIQNENIAQKIFQKLKKMGVSLAMDDFGTGYSSLSYLKQFPFNTLKIDRSFVQNAFNSSEDRAIIRAIIDLGRDLNISVVAEGVETNESQVFLQNLGCRYMQGYYFSRPLTAEKATELLQERNFITK